MLHEFQWRSQSNYYNVLIKRRPSLTLSPSSTTAGHYPLAWLCQIRLKMNGSIMGVS
uniref:Uncharacterized protein n=1 Tax=Anguilla anguilla TaxID=7936 RepID=A0A0E9VVZ7_ANGAN